MNERTATFVIGPVGCSGTVGPISFSSYELPGGYLQPYEEQVLIDHAEGSGGMFGAGLHTLTVSLGNACNWQVDLYNAPPKDTAPHHGLYFIEGGGTAWDFRAGQVCEPPATPTPPTTPTPTPTPPATPPSDTPPSLGLTQDAPHPADTGNGGPMDLSEPSTLSGGWSVWLLLAGTVAVLGSAFVVSRRP